MLMVAKSKRAYEHQQRHHQHHPRHDIAPHQNDFAHHHHRRRRPLSNHPDLLDTLPGSVALVVVVGLAWFMIIFSGFGWLAGVFHCDREQASCACCVLARCVAIYRFGFAV